MPYKSENHNVCKSGRRIIRIRTKDTWHRRCPRVNVPSPTAFRCGILEHTSIVFPITVRQHLKFADFHTSEHSTDKPEGSLEKLPAPEKVHRPSPFIASRRKSSPSRLRIANVCAIHASGAYRQHDHRRESERAVSESAWSVSGISMVGVRDQHGGCQNQNGRCRESAWSVSGIRTGGVRDQHGRCQNQHCSVLDLVDSFGS